ncbi:MAG: MgtC/SapB family protein [Euzebyaceae bacterium]|nr:MgtC/SapB family protein [Euzebyaceae bacterium]
MVVAAALSIPVGLDRELRGKSAGLRTHVVVAVASAALGYLSVLTATSQGEDATASLRKSSPALGSWALASSSPHRAGCTA